MNPDEIHRLVDALQRIYAVVLGLSITEGLKRFIKVTTTTTPEGPRDAFEPQWKYTPEAASFLATVIPFFHGMNRHIDINYYINKNPSYEFLFVDFLCFFLLGCFFFALASTTTVGGFRFYKVLLSLFCLDLVWSYVSGLHCDFETIGWIRLDIAFIGAIFAAIYLLDPLVAKVWHVRRGSDMVIYVCLLLTIGRTLCDYYLGWNVLYFGKAKAAGVKPGELRAITCWTFGTIALVSLWVFFGPKWSRKR